MYQQQNGVLRVIAYGSRTLQNGIIIFIAGNWNFFPSSDQFVNSSRTICITHLRLEYIQTITH